MIVGRARGLVIATMLAGTAIGGQAPQPFPKPTQPTPTAPNAPPPGTKPGTKPATPSPGLKPPATPDVPTEASLGVPLYPGAQFITSYDAGRGQRFYLYGAGAPLAEIVAYYRTALMQKGSELFESPPTHQFEVGRFREETMAFPPSVTIKDFTWGGSAGYPNPKRGSQPPHFATIIQIVPALPGTQN